MLYLLSRWLSHQIPGEQRQISKLIKRVKYVCPLRLRISVFIACGKWSKLSQREDVRVKQNKQLTAIIEREGSGYVALCPELDIASQGESIEQARQNLVEALELFFETADPMEVQSRLHDEVFVTRLEVAVG